jgi:hypothetical protein
MKIFYISCEIFERPLKFAELLKENNLKVTLITLDKNHDMYHDYFEDIIIIQPNELKKFINLEKPDLIHHFSKTIDFYTIELINSKVKFIFDYKDIFPYINNLPYPQWNLQAWEIMLKHNNPIIYRDTQYKELLKRGHYEDSLFSCYIPDFIWHSNFNIAIRNDLPSQENINKMVFIGNFSIEKLEPNFRGLGQLEIVKSFISQNIDYTIYPFRHDYADKNSMIMDEYIKIANHSKFFHLKDRVGFKNLQNELMNYGWGIHLLPFSHSEEFSCMHYLHLPACGIASRISDYLGAGLPIVVSEDSIEAAEWINKNDIGIVLKKEELYKFSEIISQTNYQKLRNNVKEFNINFLNPNKWFKVLMDFYTSI